VNVYAELWIEIEKKPLTNIRTYRSDNRIIAQSAEFDIEQFDRKLTFGLHQYPNSGEQLISIWSNDDERPVRVDLFLVSLNDVIREHLEATARAEKTIAYTDLAVVLNDTIKGTTLDKVAINKTLKAIDRREHEEGRPLLSAVVLSSESNLPSQEFFDLAQELGIYDGVNDATFHTQELKRVYEHWRQVQGSDKPPTDLNFAQN